MVSSPFSSLPIIQAHEICPFDRILHPLSLQEDIEEERLLCFHNIGSILTGQGSQVFHFRVGGEGSLDRRARDIRDEDTSNHEGMESL